MGGQREARGLQLSDVLWRLSSGTEAVGGGTTDFRLELLGSGDFTF